MYFKRLEIFGFKSFADKTTINFEPGITAIVGPNGCGKSNIFDSIRWVLGEQSVKELRGSSMEDVIFNGTDKKPALGFAEVSLTFSNESKVLPIDYDEVMVTRRLYRSGESEYLINKATVRLKDIQELLMGTGIGAEAYSLVQQGKVDLVVSARPEDRRILLDEASGITKYKAKKKEALSKLQDTENNLLRINDIIIEVKRQIASIERQANKARKYKVEFEKLKSFETEFARHQLGLFAEERKKISDNISEIKAQEINLNGEMAELNGLLEGQINLLDELEQNINDVKSDDIKLESQIDINNKQIGFNEERIENLSINALRLEEKKKQLIERCRSQQEKIEGLKKAMADLEELIRQKAERVKLKKDCLRIVEEALAAAKKGIHENEEKILDITSKQVNIKNSLTEVMKELQGGLARKRRLDLENTKVFSEKEQIDERLRMNDEQVAGVQGRVSVLRNKYESDTDVMNQFKAQLSVLHQQLNDLERKKIFLESQKEFIEKLQVQYQDIPDPVVEGRLITRVAPLEKNMGIIGKVKEVLSLNPEKRQLFGGDSCGDSLQQWYEIVCEAKFIELEPQQIIAKISDISQEIALKSQEKETLVMRIEEQEKTLGLVSKDMHDEEKSLSILEAQREDILKEMNKIVSELELVDSEILEVRETLTQLKKNEEELTYHLDTLNQDFAYCQNLIKEKQEFISMKLQEREETTVLIAQLDTELESGQERKKSERENLAIFEQTLDRDLEEIKRIDDEQSEYGQKKTGYETEIGGLNVKIAELKDKKQSLQGILVDYERQRAEVSQRIDSLRSNNLAIEEDINQIKRSIHAQELKFQEISFNEKGIKDRLIQTYKIDIDAGSELISPEEPLPFSVSSEEFMSELERLKKRCDSFGAVNLVAIEEFDELKERYEFLTKQQSDLLEAKDSLHQTINKINRQTRQMFMETFTRVSEEFRIYFRMLFGGGEAQLLLLDPENVLESGIEIVARPPGKKLQNISLLSGGEKSLTAIALIFGVFKVRPSPFCILDEIDAALDEANVGRYSYLLKDFAKIAQFIVITHNKKTIAISDVMYGITMQERGVSKIVSVKFSEEEKEKEVQEEVPVGAV
ncbi:MAG: AAA family ATPase [Candidatus Omnitrophota bacterium]